MKNAKIEEVFEFIRNGASIKQGEEKMGAPITRIETIWNETIDQNRFGYANILEDDLIKYEKYLLQEGDMLMSHINSPKHLGKCALYQGVPKTLIHGMNLLALRAKKDVCLPQYLNYFFNSKFFKIQLSKISNQSVNQASFSAGNLKKLEIPLPPLETQKRIAQILDDANALRQKTEKLLKEYDTLAQSIFLDMFGDPVTNPKEWEKKTLKQLTSKIGSGSTPTGGKESYKEEGISLVRSLNIHDNEFRYKNLAFLDDTQASKLKNVTLQQNDVLFNITGASVARCAIVPTDVIPARVNQHVSILRVKNTLLNPIFLLHLLISPNSKKDLLRVGSQGGATREAITKDQLESFLIIHPDIKLQDRFAEKISLIEKQKEIAKQELAESEDLFNCLLQKAFKGELS